MARKILVVDDEKLIVKGIRFSLLQDGMEVDCAYDGEEALTFAREQQFDIILLDIMLPGDDGYTILEQLKSMPSVKDVPVIMVTSRDSEADEVLSMSYGADDYITKPYNPTILLLRINAVFKRLGAKSDNTTAYRGMEILPHKGVIKYKDDEIILTKNEMTIFMYLLSHREHIVSRDELMTELWNNEEYLNDNALTVNISRLRGRFKDIGLEDVIETRKGQGYILV